MNVLKTKDGSLTLFSERYQEAYHATNGARREAFKKFVEPCRISRYDDVDILDVCFGLGYKTAAAIESRRGTMRIVGLEIDQCVLDTIGVIEYPFACKALITEAVREGCATEGDVSLHITVGDARQTVKTLKRHTFDVVFFDPFSPKACPELWTAELFADIFFVMKPGSTLATFSCARVARDNLKKVGFVVQDGPIIGRRGPSTIAMKKE